MRISDIDLDQFYDYCLTIREEVLYHHPLHRRRVLCLIMFQEKICVED